MDKRNTRKPRSGVRPTSGATAAATVSSRSTWRNPSEIFNPSERSSSAFPTVNESMNNLSIGTVSASAKDARSQSVRHVNHRRALCSAVPDSAVLSPVHRPDKGGSKGQGITVYTNHFRVDIGGTVVYQYDIDIAMIDRNQRSRLATKDDRWDVIQVFVKERKDFPVVWYDEGKTLYTREMLPDVKLPIQIQLKKDDETKRFQLNKLDLVGQNRITDIQDFIQKKSNLRPREAIRIIEILFKQRARNDLISVRNQFYDRRQKLEDLNDGRCMAKGFYQALCLTQCGPTLNINLTFTCFYMPLSFIDFASKYLRRDITRGLNETDAKKFERLIRNLKIETMHTGRRIFYRFRRFGRPANQIMFPCNEDDNRAAGTAAAATIKEISVADYFAKKYRRLMHPNLNCIDAMKGNENQPNWLPMEVARVVEWQRALRPLDKQQRGSVSRNTIIKPAERYDEIMKIVRNNQFNRDTYLKELNIGVDDKEMLKLTARVLSPPDIKYRRRGQGEVIERVRFGKWRVQNWFYETPIIHSWGIIYFGDEPNREINDNLNSFQIQLPQLLRQTGFIINTEPSLTIENPQENDVQNALSNASEQGWQLAIVILNSFNSDEIYNLVKSYSNGQIGLMTQCVNYQALKRNISKLHMYVENISQKINAKLGGINGVVNIKSALSRSSRDDLFMFFGADVTHSTTSSDRPSIAAVVGSRDLTNTLYSSRICEQYPKKGRCSVEIIKELDKMVAELLQVFARGCGNRLPNKIVFYRDGVDEGQYQKVLDHEVMKIKAACRAVYGNKPLPQLTFIVVKKRHNTRFFLYENEETSNVPAGTVVDQNIIHPSQFDFYLCSQAALMGTSRPALYHVLHDDIGFSSDDIQQLTYWLCHTDMRCTKSVSIPAPVHYAHLAAYASRTLKFGEDHDTESLDGDNEEPENYSLEDIKTNLMVLDEKIADDMWFI
jgi:eukaryotic translation initiation factor 2C